MSRFLLLSVSLIFVSLAAFGQGAAAQQTNVLWYAQPARSWMTEALPLGNGSLGGMFFGLTGTEHIQSLAGEPLKVCLGDRVVELPTRPGESYRFDPNLSRIR